MSYQAVIRNASNALVTSHAVGMQISILQGSSTGTPVYVETQTPATNANGLVTIEIGSGTPVTGTFASINWSNGPYFIKTETDPAGGTTYSITGTSQLLSVPYALFAKTAGSHYIGELYGGGIIFYVDKSGDHGLICNMVDLSTSQTWSNVTSTLVGTTSWNGQGNSTAIINQSGHTSSAAKLCDDYTNADYNTGIYSDWYLPAIDELSKLWHANYEVNKAFDSDSNVLTTGLVSGSYWSSSEGGTGSFAWYFNYSYGYTGISNKTGTFFVRAIRAF